MYPPPPRPIGKVDLSGLKRKFLLNALASRSYVIREEPFKLSSGALSIEYLDTRKTLSSPLNLRDAATEVGKIFYGEVDAVGGMGSGADPIAIAISMLYPASWFSVRKTPKEHGAQNRIEGFSGFPTGEARVAIVEDVVTTGASTIEAIKVVQGAGMKVVRVVTLIDREEGGLDNIRQVVGDGVEVRALYTLSEIRDCYKAHYA